MIILKGSKFSKIGHFRTLESISRSRYQPDLSKIYFTVLISNNLIQIMGKTFVSKIFIFNHFLEILFDKNMPNMAWH